MHSRFLSSLFAALLSLPLFAGEEVFLHGPSLHEAAAVIAGRGLETGGRATAAGAGREVVWREVRRETDTRGGTHVFHRQYVTGNGLDAELQGSEVAMHYLPGGRLLAIAGRQFESVVVDDGPLVSPDRALRAADRAFDREDLTRFDKRRAERLAATKLRLVRDGGIFRPAYATTAEDLDGDVHDVLVDARTGMVLSSHAVARYGNCTPDKTTAISALGYPVRAPGTRSLKASETITPRSGFTHEGYYPAALYNGTVKIYVYQTVVSSPTWECNGDLNYTLLPIKKDLTLDSLGRPLYVDTPVEPPNGMSMIYGRAAADALYHTERTMRAFDAMGRKGWDNNYGPAHVVVNLDLEDVMRFSPAGQGRGPANSLQIGRGYENGGLMYNGAASLDWIAHEWGHGVITKTANFDLSTLHGKQLEEGFADVIAMIVEKRIQPSGTGLEQDSDWVMHEDAAVSGYARGAKDDGATHPWVGPAGTKNYDDRVHYNDQPSANEPHATGNLLNVAHMLMAIGGKNPICARPNSSYSGCEATNEITSPIGSDKAGSLLFHAIQFNLNANTTWEQVADRVNLAAFERFNQCSVSPSLNAAAEQDVVAKAFRAIGYPRSSTTPIACP